MIGTGVGDLSGDTQEVLLSSSAPIMVDVPFLSCDSCSVSSDKDDVMPF